jgi:hypothetical protein
MNGMCRGYSGLEIGAERREPGPSFGGAALAIIAPSSHPLDPIRYVTSFISSTKICPEEEVVALCKRAGYRRTGIPLLGQSSRSVIAWIKYGPYVTVPEARMQYWTVKALNDNPVSSLRVPHVYCAFTRDTSACTIGFIAMEYINAPTATWATFSWWKKLFRR